MRVLIRLAKKVDARVIAAHNVALAEESEKITISLDQTFEGVMSVLEDPGKGFYLVVEEKGVLIGQLMITFEWSDWRNKNIWWIQSVYIKPLWRKKGVFRNLLTEVYRLGQTNGVQLFRLYVHRSNADAIKVYRQLKMVEGSYQIFERFVQ
jgi:GNAT superfamily N-acetyltransferase